MKTSVTSHPPLQRGGCVLATVVEDNEGAERRKERDDKEREAGNESLKSAERMKTQRK